MSELTPIPEQSEDVSGRPIAFALAWTLVGIAISTLIVWALMAFQAGGGGRSDEARPTLVPPAAPFAERTDLERARDAQLQHLESWSWVDREHRIVRIPAELAIERYVGGAK